MSKFADKADKRLAGRRAAATTGKEYTLPGSLNPSKSFPRGKGHRSQSQVQADSRSATS